MATETCKVELSQELSIWAKKNLTVDEVNKLFLATGNEGMKVFHVTTQFCELDEF